MKTIEKNIENQQDKDSEEKNKGGFLDNFFKKAKNWFEDEPDTDF